MQVASSDVMAAYFWKRKKRGSNPTRCERLPKSLLLKVIMISEEQFEPANEMEDLTVQGAISKVITYL